MLKLVPIALACAILPVRGASDDQNAPALVAGDRKSSEDFYQKAKEAFQAKDFPEAIRLNNDSVKADPSNPAPVVLLGCIEMEKRDFKSAREYFLRSQKLAPDNINNSFNLAEVDYAEKKWTTARAAFEAILKREGLPKNFERLIRFKLTIIALKLGDRKAVETHREVFRKDGAKRELAFSEVLDQADAGTLSKQAIRERCIKLAGEFEDCDALYDSLFEAYYTPAP